MANTTKLSLPYIEASQSQKHITHNEAILALDTLVQASVLDRNLSAPPVSPQEGDTYLIAASPTGLWTGHAGELTVYSNATWYFYTPKIGWLLFIVDEAVYVRYTGTSWVAAFTQSGATWGWQDWAHSGSSQALTSAGVFYPLTNNGLGSGTNLTFKVPAHGNIWNTTTNQLDFSDLSIGDEVTLRADVDVTTSGSNHEITLKATFDIGGTPFDLVLAQETYKTSGTHKLSTSIPFYIGSTNVRDNPAEIRISSDNTGDSALVNGWYIKTQVR